MIWALCYGHGHVSLCRGHGRQPTLLQHYCGLVDWVSTTGCGKDPRIHYQVRSVRFISLSTNIAIKNCCKGWLYHDLTTMFDNEYLSLCNNLSRRPTTYLAPHCNWVDRSSTTWHGRDLCIHYLVRFTHFRGLPPAIATTFVAWHLGVTSL